MRKNKPYLVLIVLSLSFVFKVYSQEDFVILTIEKTMSRSSHGKESFFWIIPKDSIQKLDQKNIYPLLLSRYLHDDVDLCCAGKDVDPYSSTYNESNTLDSVERNAIKEVLIISKKRRRNIQEIQKKWGSEYWVKIKFFATPVSGQFCFCRFDAVGRQRSDYNGVISLPKGKIKYNESFWSLDISKILKRVDFSKLNFDFLILYNKI